MRKLDYYFVGLLVPLLLWLTPALARPWHQNVGREIGHCFSGGCDVVADLNRRFDQGLSSKAAALTEPTKRAAEEAVDHIFRTNIIPYTYLLNGMIEADIDRIKRSLDSTIDLARVATKDTIDAVRDQIIVKTSTEIKSIVDAAFEQFKCTTIFTRNEIQGLVDDNFTLFKSWRHAFSGMVDKCSVKDKTNGYEVYRGLKCQFEQAVEVAPNVGDLIEWHRKFLETAARASCSVLEPDNQRLVYDDRAIVRNNLRVWMLALQ